jgi:uncharacterized protein (TIGR02145 family)
MKRFFAYPFIYLFGLSTLYGQVEQQSVSRTEELTNKRAGFNLDEIRVRWKKAALENCAGVPCVVAPPFTCGDKISDIDGNLYNTLKIGEQCWLKENLKVTRYNDGTLIPDSTSSTFGIATFGVRTSYPSAVVPGGYVATYGYLYNWFAATDSRKLCPAGWKLPTDDEWTILIKSIDPNAVSLSGSGVQSSTAGGAMKTIGTDHWDDTDQFGNYSPTTGTNSSGFSAVGTGYRNKNALNGTNFRGSTWWWSATTDPSNSNKAWLRFINTYQTDVYKNNTRNKPDGLAVRCLKE